MILMPDIIAQVPVLSAGFIDAHNDTALIEPSLIYGPIGKHTAVLSRYTSLRRTDDGKKREGVSRTH